MEYWLILRRFYPAIICGFTLWTSYKAYHWVGFLIACVIVFLPLIVTSCLQWYGERLLVQEMLKDSDEQLARARERINNWTKGDPYVNGAYAQQQEFVSGGICSKRSRMGKHLQDGSAAPGSKTIQ